MKCAKYLMIALAIMTCSVASAQSKKTKEAKKPAKTEKQQTKSKKAKKQQKEVVAEAPQVKPDTINVDTFSYAFGKANTQGLQGYLVQRMGIDTTYMADFVKGFDEGAELTAGDKALKARLAGKEIRSQVEKQIMPQISKQINDSVNLLNEKMFLDGFRQGIAGGEDKVLNVSDDSLQTIVRKQMEYYQAVKLEQNYGANRRAGEAFLAANKTKDSIQVTPSGLQYKVITMGSGEKPTAKQKVKVNYRGTLIDGTEFDSSYKRKQPATFACDQVIKGWTEALTMMPVGSKWMLYIPQELGYGSRESGKIPPFSALIFEVELLEIVK